MNVAHGESDATSDFVDVHVRGSLQLHAVLVHTISRVYRLGVNEKTKWNVRVSVHETGDHTATYFHHHGATTPYQWHRSPSRT